MPQATETKGLSAGTPGQRQDVRHHILALVASGDQRNYVDVTAKRLGLPTARVARIMAGLMLAAERRAASYETAMANARSMADEAAAEVWFEVAS